MSVLSEIFQAVAAVFKQQEFAPVGLSMAQAGGGPPGVRQSEDSRPTSQDGDDSEDGSRVLMLDTPHAPLPDAVISRTAKALVSRRAEDSWRTTRALFDLGYVRCGTAHADRQSFDCYLRSETIKHPSLCGGDTRGVVAMSRLGSNGRFANQLFQYAYVKLYALRHELTAQVPAWVGKPLFGLNDPEPQEKLTPLNFFAFDDDDLALWQSDDVSIDVDLDGYFQEMPSCWARHREFLRRLYDPHPDIKSSLDEAAQKMMHGGRALIAVHVRRGDYPELYAQGLGWYRPIPITWYKTWLKQRLAETANVSVYVASDEPDEVLSYLADFMPEDAAMVFGKLDIPTYVLDFEMLRRADVVAVVNSSFSRMAAILAADRQHAWIADYDLEGFKTFDAWTVEPFWDRFGSRSEAARGFGSSLEASRQRSVRLRLEAAEWRKSHAEALQSSRSLQDAYHGLQTAFEVERRAKDGIIADHAAAVEQLSILASTRNALHNANVRIGALENAGDERQRTLASAFNALQSANLRIGSLESAATETQHALACVHTALHNRNVRVGSLENMLDERLRTLDSTRLALQCASVRIDAMGLEMAGKDETLASFRDALLASVERQKELEQALDAAHVAHADREALLASVERQKELERALDAARMAHADREALLASVKRQKELERALDAARVAHAEAEHAVHAATFLSSPAGLARRVTFRPVIEILRISRNLASALGLNVGKKLAHDEALLRGRRYKDWVTLMRRRAGRLMARPAAGGIERLPTPDTAPHSGSSSRLVELMQTAKTAPPSARRLHTNVKPAVVIVVPWLVQGGSEVVLLDVLKALSAHVSLSIVTTIHADHVMTEAFRPFVGEIHHLNGEINGTEAVTFLDAFCRSRRVKLLLSSNASLIYSEARRLKDANPRLRIADILHNDLREGHFASALAASPSIDTQIVVSAHIAKGLQAEGVPSERIAVIANGIDVDGTFNPAQVKRSESRRNLELNEGDFVVGYVGRMSQEKRPLAFLDIVARLPDTPGLRVVLVGSGGLDPEVASVVANFRCPVTWLRHLPRAEMNRVYACLDVVILPSTIEGMPLVVLEAMAMGVPVAATDVGNVRDLIEDGTTGFIRAVDRYEDLAQPVAGLAADPQLRARMGTAARRAIIEKGFTRSAMALGYVGLIQKYVQFR